MSDAPKRIWVGPNEDDIKWGELEVNETVFWEISEMSRPDDRDGLSEYVRADLLDKALEDAAGIADEFQERIGDEIRAFIHKSAD